MENFLFEKCILRYFKHEPTTDQKSGINKLSRFIFYNKKKGIILVCGIVLNVLDDTKKKIHLLEKLKYKYKKAWCDLK